MYTSYLIESDDIFQFYYLDVLKKHNLEPLPPINFIVNTEVLGTIKAENDVGIGSRSGLLDELRTGLFRISNALNSFLRLNSDVLEGLGGKLYIPNGTPDIELIPVILNIANAYLMGASLEDTLVELRKVEEKISLPTIPILGYSEKQRRMHIVKIFSLFEENLRSLLEIKNPYISGGRTHLIQLMKNYLNSKTKSLFKYEAIHSSPVTYTRRSCIDNTLITKTIRVDLNSDAVLYDNIFIEIENYLNSVYTHLLTLPKENENKVHEFFAQYEFDSTDVKLDRLIQVACRIALVGVGNFCLSSQEIAWNKLGLIFNKQTHLGLIFKQTHINGTAVSPVWKLPRAIVYNLMYQLISEFEQDQSPCPKL